MFWATMCPSSGEVTVSMRHLASVTLCGWLSGMQDGPCIPDSHLYRIISTKCHIDTVISPDEGHIVAQNMWRKEISILRKIVHQVVFIYKIFPQDLPTRTFYEVFVLNLAHGNVCIRTTLSVTHLNNSFLIVHYLKLICVIPVKCDCIPDHLIFKNLWFKCDLDFSQIC